MSDRPEVPGCDAPEPRPVYLHAFPQGGEPPVYRCRCIVCARCSHHTGNTTQGHYWGSCRRRPGEQPHHFCCPDDCELDVPRSVMAVLRPGPGQRSLIPPVHPMMSDVVADYMPRVGRPVLWDDTGRDSSS